MAPNSSAGQRTKAFVAYVQALGCLTATGEMLPAHRWEFRHDLMFAVELHQVECEF